MNASQVHSLYIRAGAGHDGKVELTDHVSVITVPAGSPDDVARSGNNLPSATLVGMEEKPMRLSLQ
ncbi:MAG: hypothetical protein ACJA00_001499 [Myxococcota bacterium]